MPNTIPEKESLRVEFKSNRHRLSDAELAQTVVCLANTDGGTIYLGVEDDARPTGLNEMHRNLSGLAALVANRTAPPISVRVTALELSGQMIAMIEVPRSLRPVATSDGTLLRRRLKIDGKPECVPFLPHEFATRQSDLGQLDYSQLPVSGAGEDDFDPLERERLRQMIERYGGDRALRDLADRELDGSLGLVWREGRERVPTVAGLLLIGRESALREHLPTHEVAFQVLEGTDVRVNEFHRGPLLKTFERVVEQFEARIEEDEIQVGHFRIPVPSFDRRAFREALVNALTHHDYTRLGAAHVRMSGEGLTISNPGGFVEGVSLDNLLVTEPKPRNPLLADAFKRIGLAERTGRGVDLIFQGLLRYGRPAPDYARSDRTTVIVQMSGAEADTAFLRMIIEEEARLKTTLPLDPLLVLALLRREKRITVAQAAETMQKDESAARGVLERLVEAGLVDAYGFRKGRSYTLSAKVYRRAGDRAGYVRQAGFDVLQQEQMIIKYVQAHGQIRRREVIELCKIGPFQASRLLKRLTEHGALKKSGQHKATFYEGGPNLRARS